MPEASANRFQPILPKYCMSVVELVLVRCGVQGPSIAAAAPATLDGLKAKGVAVREGEETGGGVQAFVGTGDENYGATLRPLPPPS